MKKRILLITLMVAMLVFLFVVGASAITPNNDGETYTTSGGVTLALYDTDGNALAWFKDPTTSEYVPYRVVIDFTATLGSGREIHTNNKTLNDTDGDASTTFPYSLDQLIVFNARDYSAFTYISGTWSGLPLEAIYVNNNFQWINKESFKSDANIRVFDIPKDTLSTLHFGGSAFWGATNLQAIFIPKNSYFEGGATFENSGIQTVEFAQDYTRTSIPNHTFYKCYKLGGHLVLPNSITEIQKFAFAFDSNVSNNTVNFTLTLPSGLTTVGEKFVQNNNSLVAINFTGTSLTAIDSPAFENCKRLTSIVLPEGLEILGNCAFKNCSGLKNVTFPSTLTTLNGNQHFLGTALTTVVGFENTKITSIPYQSFKGLSTWKPETLIIPNTVTSIGTNGIADIGMKTLVLGAGLTSIANDALAGCKSLQTIYVPAGLDTLYLNTSTARLIFVTSKDQTVLEGFKADTSATSIITKAEYDANPSSYASGKYIISGVNVCDAFYNSIHELDPDKSNACAGICANCGELSLSANPVHIEKVVITFADLAKAGTKVTTCKNENCPYHVEETLNAVFTFNGYSSDIATRSYITAGYLINHESLEAYKSTLADGVAFSFGFVGLATKAENTLNTTPIDATTGEASASNMMQVDLSKEAGIAECTAVDFKIAGDFTNEVYAAAKIGMALYTSLRTTSGGVDTYTINYIVADGEKDSKSSTEISEVVYQTKFSTQNEEVVD